jgi:type IV pilus assembly protein PilW
VVIQAAAGGNEALVSAPRTPNPVKPMTDNSLVDVGMGQTFGCKSRKQLGETLVGLLVGLGVGLVVLAAGSQMLAQLLRGHRLALQDSHMHHDLRSALDTITRELRQAQSIGQAWRGRTSAHCTDAFCAGKADLVVQGQRINYGQDRNQNGLLDNNECSGFRLKEFELQIRTACTPEVWTDLTDAGSLKMTHLAWQVNCEKRGRWAARWVTVQLSAQWPHDTTRTLSLSQTVSLRNDVPASPWPAVCGATP